MIRALLACCALIGCDLRAVPARDPVYSDVAPALERACGACHGSARAEGGYRVDRYLEAIACPDGSPSAVSGPDPPLLAALERPDHEGLLTDREDALVRAWIEAGAPAREGSAHPAGWIDPRSMDFHGRALRSDRWARMLDGSCARCHEGLADDGGSAPGATSCASCHREDDGPRACSTCHGVERRAFPPRDPCWHPQDEGGAHEAHAALACASCHGERTIEGLAAGLHGDGEVQADPGACASCHDRGGAVPSPRWTDTLECGSCHESPPEDHYEGACNACHDEAAPDASALVPGPLHANGRVDLGDGSGGCGACHGEGDDPMPGTGSHAAHARSRTSAPIDCGACHDVPAEPGALGHFDRTPGAEVRFGALASARGALPIFEDGTCRNVACHGAGLDGGSQLEPTWGALDGLASRCGACHGTPPPAPHTDQDTCASTSCHGGLVGPGPSITDLGRATHVDGRIDRW